MSKPRSQTIRIFLPTGNPRGIRKVERTSNSNIRLIEIPRTELNHFYSMAEANDMGIYFLAGTAQLYIGQTTDLCGRIKHHDKTKSFWQRAFVVVLNNDFRTIDHLYCLEKAAIEHAQAAGRFTLDNSTAGSAHRHLHDSIRSDCENIFDEIDTLLAVLNQDFFETKPLQIGNTARPSENHADIFYCKRRDADAKGYLHEDGKKFVLLADSVLSRKVAEYLPDSLKQIRQNLLSDGLLAEHQGRYLLKQDYCASSVSYAAALVTGKNENGWLSWKNAQGQTLDECFRNKKAV